MLVSIIIPALNEAAGIAKTLQSLQHQASPFEIILVDGGSSDNTKSIAASWARVVDAPRGRAMQMNAGAQAATGDVLLFLHADSHLPSGALTQIRNAVDDGAESGNFRLKFDQAAPLLSFYSFFTRFKFPRFCFGDRGLFIKTELFEQLQGFAAIPIFEDLEFVRRLHNRGTFTFLNTYVTTAARRFENKGLIKQQLLNAYLWTRYLLGTAPEKLAPHYTYEESTP